MRHLPDDADRSPRVRAVLNVVDRIPSGRVLTYGDVADWIGSRSPRQVGQIMARWGHEVAWFRVVLADGSCAAGVAADQLVRLVADGVPLTTGGRRVDLRRARWDGR